MLGLVPRNLGACHGASASVSYTRSSSTRCWLPPRSAGYSLAPAAAITGKPWINVNYLVFLAALLVALGLAHIDRPPAAPARFATSATRADTELGELALHAGTVAIIALGNLLGRRPPALAATDDLQGHPQGYGPA